MFGLRGEAFWHATPAQIAMLTDEHAEFHGAKKKKGREGTAGDLAKLSLLANRNTGA
ncbi:MAG: hypothetical protein M3404_02505 [Actinomycetota bacterium]|nr:hypothetical protein [Actinomycetota bacterium]